jgi:hypothetical protein
MGRHSEFTQEIADVICARMAQGESVRQICRDEGMPAESTVRNWSVKIDAFHAQFTRAREAMLLYWEDEIAEIADDSTNDWMERETEKGRIVRSHDYEHWRRSQLRIDTRKWLMSKLLPKKYGERVDLRHANPDGSPMVVQVVKFGGATTPVSDPDEPDKDPA